MLKKVSLAALLVVGLGSSALAQDIPLSRLLTNLYGPTGLKVDSLTPLPDGSTHSAHFNSSFQTAFTPFNTAVAQQLASVPLPSPASGFTYELDSSLGVFKRSTQSFGPILSDRAETIGRHKVSFGFSFQHFNFDSIDGQDIGAVPVVFTHDQPAPGGRADVVTTQNSIALKLDQYTAFLNFGLTNRVDVSVAIPVVSVDLSATSVATIQRIGTTDPRTHYFATPTGGIGDSESFTKSGSKSGIGDMIFRLKANVYKEGGTGLSIGTEVRLPTGDEDNLLGSGATGLEGFLVFSSSHKTLSPHVKLAYQWNGDSILAGNPDTGTKGNMPDQFFYELGADIGVTKNLTFAADFLGRFVKDGERMVDETFPALDGHTTFPTVAFVTESYNVMNGSLGFKFNPGGNFLIDVNVLFKLNDAGLRDKVTPLVGFEYSF